MRGPYLSAVALAATLAGGAVPQALAAQGHGPVYGLSTPTLGKGGWSLDVALMSRWFEDTRTARGRAMISYGLTEDVQASLSFPLSLVGDASVSSHRGSVRMPATGDVEAMLGWRFRRRGLGVGARQETTLWIAIDEPAGTGSGSRRPSLLGAVVTGYASRSVYVWLGAGYGRRMPGVAAGANARGDVAVGSLVVGYRPAAFRGDYPQPDWRGFLELVAERHGPAEVAGAQDPGRVAYGDLAVAFTVLGLYGNWGIAGGPALPLYQRRAAGAPQERVRIMVNGILWL